MSGVDLPVLVISQLLSKVHCRLQMESRSTEACHGSNLSDNCCVRLVRPDRFRPPAPTPTHATHPPTPHPLPTPCYSRHTQTECPDIRCVRLARPDCCVPHTLFTPTHQPPTPCCSRRTRKECRRAAQLGSRCVHLATPGCCVPHTFHTPHTNLPHLAVAAVHVKSVAVQRNLASAACTGPNLTRSGHIGPVPLELFKTEHPALVEVPAWQCGKG